MFQNILDSKRGFVLIGSIVVVLVLTVAYQYWSRRITPAKIVAGKMLFEHPWTVDDELSPQGDGLGPVFNDVSCVACHFQGGTGGAGPNSKNVHKFTVLPTAIRPDVVRGVVHHRSVEPELQEDISQIQQRFPEISGVRFTDGCSTSTTPAFDPVLSMSINTPALFGLGKIEEIPSYAIAYHGSARMLSSVANELTGKFTSKGFGRVKMSGTTVGKFGWQGEFGTIEDFVAEACAVELGLSVPGRRQDKPGAFEEDSDARFDLSRRQLHEMVCFVKALPRPKQVLPTDELALATVRRGERMFQVMGCADCHVPDLGGVEGIYSDFHLYNLTPPENDDGYGAAVRTVDSQVKFPLSETLPNEWKTPPLWGVADSAPYFHDGSAGTLEAAIHLHHGDGHYSRQLYMNATLDDRVAIITFLKTLRAPDMKEFESKWDGSSLAATDQAD